MKFIFFVQKINTATQTTLMCTKAIAPPRPQDQTNMFIANNLFFIFFVTTLFYTSVSEVKLFIIARWACIDNK